MNGRTCPAKIVPGPRCGWPDRECKAPDSAHGTGAGQRRPWTYHDVQCQVPNPRPGRDFTIEIVCPEFTSVCPKTGQPDFGTITFTYTPGESCVELKSLKLYLQRFRNQGIFYEQVTNRLLDDFVAACKPVRCKVVSVWTPRGGITTTVTCTYEAKDAA